MPPRQEEQDEPKHDSKPKTLVSKTLNAFRHTTASGIESKLATERIKAATTGSKQARARIGVLHRKGHLTLPSGPAQFDARYKGKRGAAVIDASKTPSVLFFTTDPITEVDDQRLESRSEGSVLFSMPVTEIVDMRKIGGMGWKGKLIAGWAVGGKEVVDGLTLITKERTVYQVTAMRLRNELFNRLAAIDGQVWESY